MRAQLPYRILIGPLGPALRQADGGLLQSSLTHDACLGPYLRHAQLRPFYFHPELLRQPGQQPELPADALLLGGPAGWRLADLSAQLGDWRPQLLIWWGFHFALPPDLAAAPWPSVLIVSDWHYHYQAVRETLEAFDLVLCDRLLLARLQAEGFERARYWPAYGFDPVMMKAESVPREIDVLFLGNTNPATYGERNRLLARLAAAERPWRLVLRNGVPHPLYAQLLNRSKIVFNHALRGEMNLRAYEAAACGALLFQEADNREIADFLPASGPEQACVLYRPDNLVELIDYWLADTAGRCTVAARGQQRIQAFSYQAQFETLLDALPAWLSLGHRRQTGPATVLQQVRQQLTTDVPALRRHGLALLESLSPAEIASQAAAWTNALAVCRWDLRTSPASLADALAALARFDDAASLVNRAWLAYGLQDGPELAAALAGLGRSLARAGGPDPAAFLLPLRETSLHLLRQAILWRCPDDATQRRALGTLLRGIQAYLGGQLALARQQLPAAVAAFEQACADIPELAESWFELGRCRRLLQQPAAALAAFEQGLEQGVFYPAIWPLCIELQLQLGQVSAAARRLRQALILLQDSRFAGVQAQLQQLARRWPQVGSSM